MDKGYPKNIKRVKNTIKDYLEKNKKKLEDKYNIARLDIEKTTERLLKKYEKFEQTTENLNKLMKQENLKLEDKKLKEIIDKLYKNIEQREAIIYVIEFYKQMIKAPKK